MEYVHSLILYKEAQSFNYLLGIRRPKFLINLRPYGEKSTFNTLDNNFIIELYSTIELVIYLKIR